MHSFKEYIIRRDETSFNPLHRLGDTGRYGDIESTAKVVGHIPGAFAGALPAAVSGAFEVPGAYRTGITGNPYKSDNVERTKQLANAAFNQGQSWILNYTVKNPKLGQWLAGEMEQVLGYLENRQPTNIAGVQMGGGPTQMSRTFALPVALIRGILTSVKNVFDTINPIHVMTSDANLFSVNLKKILQALDAMPIRDEREKDFVTAKVEEFIHVLQGGGDVGHLDPDVQR